MNRFARYLAVSAFVSGIAAPFWIPATAYGSDSASAQPREVGDADTDRIAPVWRNTTVLDVRLEGELKTLISKAQDPNAKFKVPGRLSYRDTQGTEHELDVQIEARGKSSRKDCAFPKLELKFSSPTENTLFARTKKIKIGTHCGEQDGWSDENGRLKNQLSPHREALVYRILEALGLPSFKTRPARITYVFSDDSGKELLRNAFFLETTGSLEKRIKAKELAMKKQGDAASVRFQYASDSSDMNEVALAYLANSILSNNDFIIPIDEAQAKLLPLWNTKAFLGKDGRRFLVPYDFDLTLFVTSPASTYNIEFLLDDAKTRALAGYPNALSHAKRVILSKRSLIERIARDTDLTYPDPVSGELKSDSNGKAAIEAYLKEVFKEVEAL